MCVVEDREKRHTCIETYSRLTLVVRGGRRSSVVLSRIFALFPDDRTIHVVYISRHRLRSQEWKQHFSDNLIAEQSTDDRKPTIDHRAQVLPVGQHNLHRGAANHEQRAFTGQVHEAPAGHTAVKRLRPGRPQRGGKCHSCSGHRRRRRRQRGGRDRCEVANGGLSRHFFVPPYPTYSMCNLILHSYRHPLQKRQPITRRFSAPSLLRTKHTPVATKIPRTGRWGGRQGRWRRWSLSRARHLRPRRLRRRAGGLDPRPQVPHRRRGPDDPAVVRAQPRSQPAARGGLSGGWVRGGARQGVHP